MDNQLILNEVILSKIDKDRIMFNNLDIDTELEEKVVVFKLYPSIDYSTFDYYLKEWIRGIVLEWYWDWNTPTNEIFQDKIKSCLKAGMVVILKSQCVYGSSTSKYAGWKALLDMWCVTWRNLTSESAYTKLMWALKKYNWDTCKIKEVLWQGINGDMLL